ncbi:Mariner Mos1 transposase [Eumeta japonica]|uniref:Mariner Mos1 transposase n=1 Tax=Eumeta variegata TaxID=151549 RepID=A0A4C1ZAB4_EUMVA|nr:Mariner Mos1 transposase [Eumeta japonica]
MKPTGFYTEEVKKNRVREGFDVVTFHGERGKLARDVALLNDSVKCKVGKYGVLIEEFDKIAIPSLQGILLHYFIHKKFATEAHRILAETYGDNALSDTSCRDWFQRFKNNDFELEDKEHSGALKKFEDEKLEELLDKTDVRR